MKEILSLIILFSVIPASHAQDYPEYGVSVETVAENLNIPWSVDWMPDGTMLFTERNGDLRMMRDGKLQDPILSLDVGGVEGGLLGVAVDPNFRENNHIYLYYTYNEFLSTVNKLVRFTLIDGQISEDKVLLDGIPGGPFHDGGRIKFGPDGKLYVTTGESRNPGLSQDLNSLGGKILRINHDGTVPENNPWDNSLIYSIGHRNPQGIDWDDNGNLVATEHGPSGLRGVAHDEINVIIPGANYGWPDVIGDETRKDLQNPILHTGDDTWAPSGAEFYTGEKIPQWNGKYFVATLRGNHLHMVDFDLQNDTVISHEKLFHGEFGRLRDVATGPDGFLYMLTSNQDGRGSPEPNDDRILRVVPLSSGVTTFEDCTVSENPMVGSNPRQCMSDDGMPFVENVSEIPAWFGNTAEWWSMAQISDNEFLACLEYLMEQDIVRIPEEVISEEDYEPTLPSWLRTNTGQWSKDMISDDEFAKSIQWMIDGGFVGPVLADD